MPENWDRERREEKRQQASKHFCVSAREAGMSFFLFRGGSSAIKRNGIPSCSPALPPLSLCAILPYVHFFFFTPPHRNTLAAQWWYTEAEAEYNVAAVWLMPRNTRRATKVCGFRGRTITLPKARAPNQRFLVIESLKSPSVLTLADFAGPIIGFLHNTDPNKQLEGCRLKKEGPFPTGHTGRST